MCGLAGYLTGRTGHGSATDALRAMGTALEHRGPDDSGEWQDPDAGIGLAHRRLSIIDTSSAGHQPMASGQLVIAYNGEIYNFRQLREELSSEGHRFRGDSDTEVLLRLVEVHGVEAALSRCHGMFALALWDQACRRLHLARDRFGEKPLYVAVLGETLLFGSELAALRAHPKWVGQISRDALQLYFRHNCLPQPLTIYENVFQVRPGELITAHLDRGLPHLQRSDYWSAEAVWRAAGGAPRDTAPAELVDEFVERAGDVVERQMIADVPLGAFLSGGIDSSLVVALMQANAARPVRTFTIGFTEDAFNEAEYARRVARHLGTDHTEIILSAGEARDLIPELPQIYGEPFADSSQLPTLLVSRVTRQQVTVALSGDGGDEFYGGYTRYPETVNSWGRISRRPGVLREAAWRMARAAPDGLVTALNAITGGRWDIANGEGARLRVTDRLAHDTATTLPAYYLNVMSFWKDRCSLVRSAGAGPDPERHLAELFDDTEDPLRWMMFRDSQRYMNDDILTKVDRAAMHYSLETRAPMLDHDLARFAWSIPTSVHFLDGRGKWILRQALARFLPGELIDRPKMGFAIPLGSWLRTDLREWAEDLLAPQRLREEGWLDEKQVRARWIYHVNGDDRYALALWSVLMFQAWLRESGARV